MLKKILVSLLFLSFVSSLCYGKPPTKRLETRKTRAVKSKASPRKKTKAITKAPKKVQPRKKIVMQKKVSIPRKRIRISLKKRPAQQRIIEQQNLETTLKQQEQARVAQQKAQEAELKRQEDERISQQKAVEEQLRQQEQTRIQQEVLAAQQRADAERREQERIQQEALAAQQRQQQEDEAKRAEIIRKIHPNNSKSYQDMGLTDLFMNGYFGQNTTVAVIEAGFYHTLDPQYRPILGDIVIPNPINDWHFSRKEQILPPLSFYNPVLSPEDLRFDHGKPFRFDHGDHVLSILAEATPHAKILPVQASFGQTDGSFVRALEALSERPDVNIINMSRWLESCAHDYTQINPTVLTALRKCTDKGKIIVLSACNISIEIPTIPNPHFPAPNKYQSLSYFGANLISDLFHKMAPEDSLRKNVVISGALDNVDTIADYSVKAGRGSARHNYIATKGESYCPIRKRGTDGTSVSAPHTSAVLANLMSVKPGAQPAKIVKALFENADLRPYEQHVYGRGVLNGRRALQAVRDIDVI